MDLAQFRQWLSERHAAIMATEQDGLKLLDQDDTAGYREAMRKKAEMLAALASEAAPLLKELPSDKKNTIESALDNFSANAATSLSLDSVFYMSALLYPDDHKKGEPDNLERFIQSLS